MNLDGNELNEYRGFDGRGWICDKCARTIERAIDGWGQWRGVEAESKDRKTKGQVPLGRDLQLVHHSSDGIRFGCQFKEHDPAYLILDEGLPDFLGSDGLMKLLSFIADDHIESSEVLEMIKRLNIPGYERSRMYFEEAISEGVFEPNTTPRYHLQSDIEAVNKWIAERDTE